MLNQMMASNPKLKQVMDIVNQYGGDPDKALEEVSRQYGVTPQDIYDLLK
jgi:LysM repeat protein